MFPGKKVWLIKYFARGQNVSGAHQVARSCIVSQHLGKNSNPVLKCKHQEKINLFCSLMYHKLP